MILLKCRSCGCIWRDNQDDTVSLASPAQESCAACENMTDETTCERFPQERMLQWFVYGHLPAHLGEVSRPFGELALHVGTTIAPGPERTVALRKPLEAKDAAVRAALEAR